MKYRCWCEDLKSRQKPHDEVIELPKRIEDAKHHAYDECEVAHAQKCRECVFAAKLPTQRELDELLVQWIFRVPRAGSGDIAKALITYLEERK